ncbi:uncharacterized protein DUF4145 [Gillisia mitskevichiae]|uniref:Uncharacterized protein DUF4145 n=1 Tax=Gillisia mitskevichiae TaxID=270921 RepID=A0A495NZC0_9FLAO|nr:DUF4145 domain-containing protein [Gillisia mitskevichiae]RKS42508.1 uncharacterized protein DUF4145 [Gillisia mitskevichiae]
MATIQASNFVGGQTNLSYDRNPDKCPFCHKTITPRIYQGFYKGNNLEIVNRCPDSNCGRIFTSLYKKEVAGSSYNYDSSTVGNFVGTEFSDNISVLSENFVEIYNQASKAESINLNHVSGIGYRKALEFLIKDYLIHKDPENEEKIKKKFLGKCINDDIENPNVKEMAKRATWLGNDETHYVRKWEMKDVKDLKTLITVTLHWIEMELLTEKFKEEMN